MSARFFFHAFGHGIARAFFQRVLVLVEEVGLRHVGTDADAVADEYLPAAGVGDVPDELDRFADFAAQVVAHRRIVVQEPGDGFERHAGHAGYCIIDVNVVRTK